MTLSMENVKVYHACKTIKRLINYVTLFKLLFINMLWTG